MIPVQSTTDNSVKKDADPKGDAIIPQNTADDTGVIPQKSTEDVIPQYVASTSSLLPLNPCTVTIEQLPSSTKPTTSPQGHGYTMRNRPPPKESHTLYLR